ALTVNGIKKTAFQVNDLRIGYGDPILVRDISFEIAPGEVILLAGPNGSGKTTLLKALTEVGSGSEKFAPLGTLEGGAQLWEGRRSLCDRRFSDPLPTAGTVILIPSSIPQVKGFTVEGFIQTGSYAESDWRGRISADAAGRLDAALELLGIKELKERDIATLSDGEFQKACLAVGLTRQAEVLLLDEPTAFMDVENRIGVLLALRDIARKTGTAVIFSSHDIHDAVQEADRVFALTRDGRFIDSADKESALREAFPSL
ncbi:MAG: ABC transporter ATP-binding protein, partial [Bacteroidales bacterium]|nr:ABC transporter ATP-binding protein [Bacteroidales bacterium]